MKKSVLFTGIAVLFFMLGCMKSDFTGYQPVSNSGIRLGALLSLTGGGSSTGESSKVALELAVNDIKAYLKTVGSDTMFSLEIVDTKTDTAEALKQLEYFYGKGIRIVIGPYGSAEVAALKNFADTRGMMIISPSSVAASLAIPGDNIFRFVSTDLIQAEAMNKMMVEDNIRVIVPLVRDDLWGHDLVSSVRKNFENCGGTVVNPVYYPPSTVDYSAYLEALDTNVATQLHKFNPNEVAVYLVTLGEGAGFLAAAGNFNNLNNVYWYGSSAFALNASVLSDSITARFACTHGLPCPIYGLDDAAREKWEPLIGRIQAQTGRIPEAYAITAYDALWVAVFTCLKTGPSPDINRLKSTFVLESDNFFGASGGTLLDENGDRATGNYDFWSVKHDAKGFYWKKTARYNSSSGVLIRY